MWHRRGGIFNELEQGTVSAWSKAKYHLMQNEAKDSFVADCGLACLDALEVSCSREEFIRHMEERGWSVTWKDSRKHITFQNAEGKKVRDSNLSKTFHLNISKEALENEFERQAAAREEVEKEVAHVKSEYYQKEQELDRLIEDTEQERQKALSLQSVVQKLTDQKAKRLTEDTRKKWQIWYQTKNAAMQGYVGVLTVICLVTAVFSVIRQKVFCGDVRNTEDYVIGKYGIMRGEYMMKYQRHEYLKIFMDGTWNQYLHDVGEECHREVELAVKRIMEKEGVTEQLKNENQMEWM